MSLSKSIEENCPHCGQKQNVTFYSSVNVTIDMSLKKKVLNGDINKQICSNCNKEIDIMSGLLYHDMEKRIMINLKIDSDNNEIKSSGIINELFDKGYIYREVNNYPELIEKIELFDLSINDKVIEKIALQIKENFNEVIKDNKLNVFFVKIKKGLFKKKIVFHCFTHPSQLMKMEWDINNLSKEDKINLFNIDILRN